MADWAEKEEAFDDRVLQILMAAAVVSTLLGSIPKKEREHYGYIEGVAIWIAIFIVAVVTAINDYSKEMQFRKLERIEIGGNKGRTLSASVVQIYSDFNGLLERILHLPYDVLDVEVTQRDDDLAMISP